LHFFSCSFQFICYSDFRQFDLLKSLGVGRGPLESWREVEAFEVAGNVCRFVGIGVQLHDVDENELSVLFEDSD
jgi:hypothetical protein